MFYKSSILAAIFVLLSMGNAIAAELSNIESSIAEQPSELLVNASNLKAATTKNSASIAKARLLKISATDIQAATELNISIDKNSASLAKARLRNLSAKESSTSNSLPTTQSIASGASTTSLKKTIKDQINNTVHTIPNSIAATNTTNKNSQPELNSSILATSNDFTEQHKIADASSEINAIKQWEINKSVTLTDVLLAPSPVSTIAQAPARLPDNPIKTVKPATAPLVPTAIAKPPTPTIATQKPVITTTETKKTVITSGANGSIAPLAPSVIAKPTAPIIETKKPENPQPAPRILEAQKPETQNNEPKKWAVGVHTQLSTTGFVGVDAGYKFSPNLHARLGLNTVGFNVDYTSQGIDYKSKFNPTNVHLLGDFFPFGGGLRLTGGLVFQSNQFNATGTPNSSAIPGGIPTQISLGGTTYNVSDVGTVSSEGSFSNSVAPYLGIGFGTPISPGLGFNFDAGIMFAGSANVKLRANIPSSVPAALQTQIRNSLADQERRTNSDIGGFSVYPVISVGVSYAF
jgi:hypothetical protein